MSETIAAAVYLLSENRRAEEVVGKLNPSELERVIDVVGQQPDRFPRGTLAALQDSRPTPPPAWISVLWRSSDALTLVLVGSAKPAADHLGPVKPAALGRGMGYRRHQACPPTEPTAAPSVFPLVPCAPLRPPPCGSQGAPEPQYSAGSPVISQPGHDRHGLHKQ